MEKQRWTLPNTLTVFRMALVPVFIWVYFGVGAIWGLPIYGLACLTDVLDGAIARRKNQITRFGKVADPVADKLMAVTVVVCLAITRGGVMWWFAAALFIKELILGVFGLLAYYVGHMKLIFASEWIGKTAISLLFAGIVMCFVEGYLPSAWGVNLCDFVLGLALGVSVVSLGYYFFKNSKPALAALREKKRTEA
ncbi:MAG: CDP-alcohol phosphatidyltransferase family protein [Clostridia bacterium]|nr:CDP-alcohol phosphatidyltransferase family protein [Clostridia bacterium]